MEQFKHILVLVNGYTGRFDAMFPDFCSPLYPYWTEKGEQFLEAAKAFFEDVDTIEFASGDNHFYSSAATRNRAGFEYGMQNERKFEAERISILGHSMGCAFAEGLASAIHQQGKKVSKIVHFAAADARGIQIAEETREIPRLQLSLTHDHTLRISDMFTRPKKRKIKGVQRYGIVYFHVDKLHKTARKKDRVKWNSHFDTKAYGFVFDFLKDLERMEFIPMKAGIDSSKQMPDFLSNFSVFSPLSRIQLKNKVHTPFVYVKDKGTEYYGLANNEKKQLLTAFTFLNRIQFWWKRLKY